MNSIKLDNFRIRAHSEESKMTYNGPLRPSRKLISIVSIDLKQELFPPPPVLFERRVKNNGPLYYPTKLPLVHCATLSLYTKRKNGGRKIYSYSRLKTRFQRATVNKNNMKRIYRLYEISKNVSFLDERIIIVVVMIIITSPIVIFRRRIERGETVEGCRI